MSFEWQDIKQAATTLEVDMDTLQHWIDQGHAPSRKIKGKVQVLIEFPDDDSDTDADTDSQSPQSEKTTQQTQSKNHQTIQDPEIIDEPYFDDNTATNTNESSTETIYAIQQSHQREIQLAGGMVAAWKQLAENADLELARTRRITKLAWSTVAFLVFFLFITWWNLSDDVSEAKQRAGIAETDLKHFKSTSQTQAEQLNNLSEKIAATEEKLNREQSQSRAARQQLSASNLAVNRLSEQLNSAQKLTEAQTDIQKSLQQAIDAERNRSAALEKQLNASNDATRALQQEMTELKKQLAQLLAAQNKTK